MKDYKIIMNNNNFYILLKKVNNEYSKPFLLHKVGNDNVTYEYYINDKKFNLLFFI